MALACDSTGQIEHVEFGRGVAQQMGKVPESLGVLQTKGFPAIADGPELAFFAEDPSLPRRGAWRVTGTR